MASPRGLRKLYDEVVAVDVGARFTKAVHIRRRGDALSLVNYALVRRSADEKPLSIAELADHLRSVVKQLRTTCKNLALTLRHEDVVVLHADLPQAAPSDLRGMIKLNPKAYLGQDLPDHIFDCYFAAPGKEGDTSHRRRRKSRVLVAGARRRVVEDLTDAARLAGLNLVALTPAPVALTNAFRLVRDDSHPDAVALLDLGARHSTINIVGHGEVLLSRVVALGAEKFADVLAPEDEEANARADGVSADAMQARLQQAILTFAREVDASVGFYTSQFERHISQLFVSGGTARSQLVLQMLESELTYSCEGWGLLRHLNTELSEERVRELEYELPQLVVAVGVAVGVMLERAVRINMLAEKLEAAEARRRDPVRRLAFAGAALVGVTLAYSASLGWELWTLRQTVARTIEQVENAEKSLQSPERAAAERTAAAIPALYQFATNRVLFAPLLNALQFVTVDGIELQQLSVQRTVERTPVTNGVAQGKSQKTFKYTEQVKLTVALRNYGEYPNYEVWQTAVMQYEDFTNTNSPTCLREDSPLIVKDRSRYQPDLLKTDRLYSLYLVDIYFRPRPL